MRIRQLESFVCVCELGSITQAAAALNIVQPALGAQITALEEELGVQLLERGRRGTTVTPAGQYFLAEAKKMLEHVSTMKKTIRSFAPNQKEPLSVGLTASLSAMLAGALAQDLSHLSRSVSVQVVEDMSHLLGDRVARGDLHFALAFNVPDHKAIRKQPMLKESIFFITSPNSPYGQDKPIEMAELAKATFVIPTEKGQIIHLLKEAMAQFDLPLNVAFQIESMDAIKGLITDGTACAALPFGTVTREVKAGTLIARRIVNPPLTRTLFLLRPSARLQTEAIREAQLTIETSVSRLAESFAFERLE
ncbi:LysR family transcriptional regulator [Neorhizobium sp. Rsf11]|uniref:LysR family transcriptional regulator n=2 Tax=Neorhizobium TaxID=1525371 RepID=A0ABV0MAW5_9HYPH|nr:LysR family transcriptional regulator [Neorhizobium petrolearium]MCC2613808.1 LysR family transcriptional regulator [Neorhizobium petrolearium]WGI72117.1 LysR family transcriptional regulator [Neorhizobium petrolearium]